MQIDQLIGEIETYLSLYDFSDAPRRASPQKFVSPFGVKPLKNAAFLTEGGARDELIDALLARCDTEALDELADEYGEDSPVAQMIRRKQALAYNKVACELGAIEKTLEQTLHDAKYGGNPFYEAVCKHIDRLGYPSDAAFYRSISMPRQQFARLRDAANTLSKKTVLWIIVGLRLDYPQACDLMQKAGYHFRKNDMRDVIISYILRNTVYNLDMVNQVLDHFELAPLC